MSIEFKNNRQKYMVIFAINFCLIFVAYYGFFRYSLMADNLSGMVMYGDSKSHMTLEDLKGCLAGGRWFGSLISYVVSQIGYDYLKDQWISQLFKIIVCAGIPIWMLKRYAKEEISFYKILLYNAMFLMSTMNVYLEEQFAFTGFEVGVGLFFAVLAAEMFIRKRYILSGISVFLSISIYQSYFAITVILALAWLFLKNNLKFNREILKDCFVLLGIVGTACIVNILLPQISILLGWSESVIKTTVFEETPDVKMNMIRFAGFIFSWLFTSAQGMLPYGCVFVFLMLIYIVYIKELCYNKEKGIHIFGNTMYLFALFAVCFAIGLLQSTPALPPRVLSPLFYASGLFAFLVYQYAKRINMKRFLAAIVIIFDLILFVCTYMAGIDHMTQTKLDEIYAKLVQSEIDEYEQESGNTVENIYYYYDDDDYFTTAYRDFMFHHYFVQSFNNSSLTVSWGTVELVEWLSGRDYEGINMSEEEYQVQFGDVTWDGLDVNKQIKFDGNNMYWAIVLN